MIICPICKKPMVCYFDEWGRTPFHYHCNEDGISVGFGNIKKENMQSIINQHCIEQHMTLEYSDNKVLFYSTRSHGVIIDNY